MNRPGKVGRANVGGHGLRFESVAPSLAFLQVSVEHFSFVLINDVLALLGIQIYHVNSVPEEVSDSLVTFGVGAHVAVRIRTALHQPDRLGRSEYSNRPRLV
jgi:hypothetical protein